MATNSYPKPSPDPVVVPLNHKSYVDFRVTIQNNTDASLAITVAVQDVQENESPVFSTPVEGAINIAAGELGALQAPYSAFLATGTGTGTIDIVELY